jgi:tripartite ATP-independent transporter DctM subunit
MDWWLVIIILVGGLLVLILTGMPVAFAFLIANLVGAFCFMRGWIGIEQSIRQINDSLATSSLVALPPFIFMGMFLFHSGIAAKTVNVLNKWMGALPGRLGLIALASGTLFSTLTGSTIANTALLGSTLIPEMRKYGYKKPMLIGPIIGTGGLAMIIPPSGLAIILASIGQFSIGQILIAGILPGLLMAFFYGCYIIGRCSIQPDIAPVYEVGYIPWAEKIGDLAKYVLPVGVIIFAILGFIFIGVCTPAEAGATGAITSLLLSMVYKKLNLHVLKKSLVNSLDVMVMIFMIMASSTTYSSVLAYTGATRGLVDFALRITGGYPIIAVFYMVVVILILGTFMDQPSMIMICTPMFMPIIHSLGFSPIWFGIIMLIALEMGTTTPPFGFLLFVMKGVVPPDISLADIMKAAIPFLFCDLVSITTIILFPQIALFLPNLMK